MASVNWTDRAIASLDDIHDYLRREAPFYADHMVQQIIGAVDRLEDHPHSGRTVPEAEREDICEVISRTTGSSTGWSATARSISSACCTAAGI